ncbi:hypothetical protein MNV49_007862 [Pseudohyphozyma bogoriensis]|nr:hypothetical protein MNV49_007862 [Pseudohyphozyma bogoriensis]
MTDEGRIPTLVARTNFRTYDIACIPCEKSGRPCYIVSDGSPRSRKCGTCADHKSKALTCDFSNHNPNISSPASPAAGASSSSPSSKPAAGGSGRRASGAPPGGAPSSFGGKPAEDVKPKVGRAGKAKEKERVPVADVMGLSDLLVDALHDVKDDLVGREETRKVLRAVSKAVGAFADWADNVDPSSGSRPAGFDFNGEKAKLVQAIIDARPLFKRESTSPLPPFVEPVFESRKRKRLSPSDDEKERGESEEK